MKLKIFTNMRELTCSQVLLDYINSHDGYHKKVNLYQVAEDWSPETCGRELRLAEKKGLIQVQYYDSKYAKNLAMYAKNDTPQVSKEKYLITGRKEDGSPILTLNPNYQI